MRIDVSGDASIDRQALAYAEYRLFAALSQMADTRAVRGASLRVRRAPSRRRGDQVVCSATIDLNGGELVRLRAYGAHPYAAINRVIERLRLTSWPVRLASPQRDAGATD